VEVNGFGPPSTTARDLHPNAVPLSLAETGTAAVASLWFDSR